MKKEKTVQPTSKSGGSTKPDVSRRCRSCRWWRDKGWDGDFGIGICDNPKTIEQVSMMSEALLSRFINDQSATRMVAQSLRFSSEFGCVNWSVW